MNDKKILINHLLHMVPQYLQAATTRPSPPPLTRTRRATCFWGRRGPAPSWSSSSSGSRTSWWTSGRAPASMRFSLLSWPSSSRQCCHELFELFKYLNSNIQIVLFSIFIFKNRKYLLFELSYSIILYEDVHCDLHDGSQCGLDAKCIYEPQYDHSTCQCNKGFVGDGFECEKFHQTIDKSDCTRHSQCVNDEKCVVVSSNLSDFFYKCLVPEYHQEPEPMEPEEVPDEPQPNPDLCRSNNDCHQNAGFGQDPRRLQ